ncbi:MAG: branched-chain amino acid ABC transporter permease [Burkholderiaceae bacterium]|nr:branched-chain amino acid ABC transporter permease [Burkholderiaceae bacterium]
MFGVIAVAPAFLDNSFYHHIAVMVCLNIIMVSGLGLIARVDQLSLAHGAFVGIGAYASALAVMRLGAPFAVGLLLATIVPALVAAGLGRVILRLRGVYFVLVTFAFNELFRLVMLEVPSISGGTNGIGNIASASFGALQIVGKRGFYAVALIAAVLCVAFVWATLRSPTGRAFASIAENMSLAQASGLDTRRFQGLAFGLGSGMAGLSGGLMAHYIGFISPESFTFWLSVHCIIILVIGGRYSVLGPVLGSLLLTPLPEVLRGAVQLQYVIYGVLLILIMRFMPGGLADVLNWLLRRKPAPRQTP